MRDNGEIDIELKKSLFKSNLFFLIISLSVLFSSCNRISIPRPYGYFRVDLPKHVYRKIDTLNLPYRFDLAENAKLINQEAKNDNYWIDISYPQLNAKIYCTYKPVKGNLIDLLEDTRKIVYKHSVRADAIGEKTFDYPEKNLHGILYDLKGNTASNVQFVLTDNVHHFFRGALYFNNVPNKDSIAPALKYIREDIIRLMESFEWKK
jgi:gliding motility-associated lipoprotein GldD